MKVLVASTPKRHDDGSATVVPKHNDLLKNTDPLTALLTDMKDFTSSPLTDQLRAVMRETFNEFNALQGPMGGPHASSRFAQTASARAFSAEKLQVCS